MPDDQPDGLLEAHKRHLLQGTAYIDPNSFTFSPNAQLRKVSQSFEDNTITYLMQQLAITCRRLAILEAQMALFTAQGEGA